MDIAVTLGVALVLVTLTALIHFEALQLIARFASQVPIPRRSQVIVVILGIIVAHALEIGVFALAYVGLSVAGLGQLTGDLEGTWIDAYYFSLTVFTTLGFGDIQPIGPLRLVAGVEALNGLVLIAWSASFTYLTMARKWDDRHHSGVAGRR
jgi:hypothetical protein